MLHLLVKEPMKLPNKMREKNTEKYKLMQFLDKMTQACKNVLALLRFNFSISI